jgi:hypothetical protein
MPFGSEIKSKVYDFVKNEKDLAEIGYDYHHHGNLYWTPA